MPASAARGGGWAIEGREWTTGAESASPALMKRRESAQGRLSTWASGETIA